jgi:hypothetical protein
VTPIYIEIYSQCHLDNYLQRRQIEFQSKPVITQSLPSMNGIIKKESVSLVHKIDLPPEPQPSPIIQQIGLDLYSF